MLNDAHSQENKDWLADQLDGLTDSVTLLKPSEWAEQNRYLPPQLTPMPGPFSWDVTPYWKEPLDCFAPDSPIREINIIKGVQVGYTVALLENVIGYYIAHIKSDPMMFVTAESDLAQTRMDLNILPMLNESGLDHLITSSDEKNPRKTGKTSKKLEWAGGGFLIPTGAKNANKGRSISVKILLMDEIATFPVYAEDGKAGDIFNARTKAYEASRKIGRGSTPLTLPNCNATSEFMRGDQRLYQMPCKHCGEPQPLIWTGTNEDGTVYGIDYSRDDNGHVVEESVVYLCKYCQGAMINEDKAKLMVDGHWKPTATPEHPLIRSYKLNALYSPVGMQSWAAIVREWLACWDPTRAIVKDMEGFKVFYNNVLARAFEERTGGVKYRRVVEHRRSVYSSGKVPNTVAKAEAGSKIHFLTAAVDVHKEHLDIQVEGWCSRGCSYSIEQHKWEGDCEDVNAEPWENLRGLIDKTFVGDDGLLYKIQSTLIDSQYNTDIVHEFCGEYSSGVYPIRGVELPTKKGKLKEFSDFTSEFGHKGFNITTTIYKDRIAAVFKREWDGMSFQPNWYLNFPQDYPEVFFREFVKESKKEVIELKTGRRLGYKWIGRDAHSWDTTVYNMAAHDMIAWQVSSEVLGYEEINREAFWAYCEKESPFCQMAA